MALGTRRCRVVGRPAGRDLQSHLVVPLLSRSRSLLPYPRIHHASMASASPSPTPTATSLSARLPAPDEPEKDPLSIAHSGHLRSAGELEKGVVQKFGDLPDDNLPTAEAIEENDAAFLVNWDEHDPENPMEWSKTKRWYLTMLTSTVSPLVYVVRG